MNPKKIFLLCLVLMAFITSCTKEEDDTPGSDSRDALVGSWSTTENSKQFGQTSFTITISKTGEDQVIIKNFYNLGAGVNTVGTVSGSSITIAQQQVSSQSITGSGTLSNNKINWSYTTDDGLQKDTCTAVSTK
jgi:hypothetical protein